MADALKFYKAVQAGMRTQAGKALPPLVKRWRYTQSSDFAEIELKGGTVRFRTRYGVLDAADEPDARQRKFRDLLTRVARAGGDAPGVVAAWIDLFANGEYGVVKEGLCGAKPLCTACTLQENCRHLAAGAKESQSFG